MGAPEGASAGTGTAAGTSLARPELSGWRRVPAPGAPPPSLSVELTCERPSLVTASLEEAASCCSQGGRGCAQGHRRLHGDTCPRPGPPVGLTTAPRYGKATGPAHRGPGQHDHSRDHRPHLQKARPGHQALAGRLVSGDIRPGRRWSAHHRGVGRSGKAARAWLTRLLSCGWTLAGHPGRAGTRPVRSHSACEWTEGVSSSSVRTAWGQARGWPERVRGQPSRLPERLNQFVKLGSPQQR